MTRAKVAGAAAIGAAAVIGVVAGVVVDQNSDSTAQAVAEQSEGTATFTNVNTVTFPIPTITTTVTETVTQEPPPPTTTSQPPTTTTSPPPVGVVELQPGASLNTAYKGAKCGAQFTLLAGEWPAQEILRDTTKDACTERIVFKGSTGTVINSFRTGRSGGSGNTVGASHFELVDLDIRGSTTLVLANDVVVRNPGDGNKTPQGTKNNLVIGSSTFVQILGGEYGPWVNGINHINRCGSNPVCPPPTDILIDGVTMHDFLIDNPAPHSECMMIWGTDTNRVLIKNSVFRNCTDFGVLVKATRGRNIVFEPNNNFDVPMPGSVATTECNPNCARGGSSIRYANSPNDAVPIEPYTGSAVRNNVVKGNISVDCNCIPVEGNTK